MRRTALLFSTLLIATGICIAQEQSIDSSEKQATDASEQQSSQASDESLRDPELDQTPDAVKREILRQSEGQELKELAVHDSNQGKIYEAVYESDNSQTRFRMDETGAPVSMHIAGLGAPINEAAGARRDDQPQQPSAQSVQQQPQAASQPVAVTEEMRQRIQQQLGDETPLLEVQPKVFYQLNIRQNGNVQQIWADETGKVLREEQARQQQ